MEVLREGIAYAKARGLTEMLDLLTQSTLDELVDTGEHDEALEIAAEMAPRLEANGDVFDLITVRAVQARIHALRGQATEIAEMLDWLESFRPGDRGPAARRLGLGSVALVRAGLGQDEAAAALLSELEAYPGARDNRVLPRVTPRDGAHRPGDR